MKYFKRVPAMKRLLLVIIPFLFFACSKKENSPDKVQDIRGTKWRAEETVFTNGPLGYRDFQFSGSGDGKSGSGIYSIYSKTEDLLYVNSFTWELTGTDLKVSFEDQFNEPKSVTGSWVLGTLYLDGNYKKRN